MTRRQWKLAAAAFVIAATGFLWVRPVGPYHQRKSITTWFYHDGNLSGPVDQQQDIEAFRSMGREAVPFLVRRLEAAPSERIKGWLARVSTSAGEVYRQRKESWQYRAAFLLGEIGPEADAAEPALMRIAANGSWVARGAATIALAKIKRMSPGPWIEKLKDTSDWKAWYENAIMVGQFGPRAEAAIPLLVEALHHTNNIIPAHALIALGMIARQPETCFPAIVPFLSSADIGDRQKAMGALLAFGTNAVVVRKAIESALQDTDPWVRLQAGSAVRTFDQMEGTKKREPPFR